MLDKTGVSGGLAELEKALKQGWEEFSGEEQKRPRAGEPVALEVPLKAAEPREQPRESQTLAAAMAEVSREEEAARNAAVAAAPPRPAGYGQQNRVSSLTRISAMSPLKQAVVWKEILDTPRGLS